MSLSQRAEGVSDRGFVEVPLDEWQAALRGAPTPSDPAEARVLADLKLGAARAAGHASVLVQAGHVRLALRPATPAPDSDSSPKKPAKAN